jgi:demethylmenaquinone methyltransferase/2-methoxy-6-polyprenyl-1,4-benzoquinol methylase
MKKSLRNVAEAYDRTAPFYDLINRVYFFGRDSQFRSILVENLNLKPNYTVLNLCFGTGLDFAFLHDKLDDQSTIIGVDLSIHMMHQSKQKKDSQKMNLIRADIGYLPFSDNTFHAIMVSFCLKITPTYNTTMKELVRVLKLNGRLGILANHKPQGLMGKIITKILSATAKINFGINLTEHLPKELIIIKNQIMYGNLVELIIVKNINKTI